MTVSHDRLNKLNNSDNQNPLRHSSTIYQGRHVDIKQKEFILLRKAAQTIGNKATNLKILKQITNKTTNLTTPHDHAVTHQTISAFLNRYTKGKFQEKWSLFCQIMQKEKGLTNKTLKILTEIETLISNTFCKAGKNLVDIKYFLSKIPAKCRTIIRSSSLEDTLKLANAGGNKTCINIPPEKKEIAKAMGKVVASYFSARSIGQRLQAGDDITRAPFMPVLLQVMVGETVKSGIPASGVIFADESTGRTPKVSCIEAAWGHNELVVGGLGPVDRYFVGPNSRVHKVVVCKKDRLVSRKEGKGLMRITNPPNTRYKPALTNKSLLQLHTFYQTLKPFYGGHVDGEFTKLDQSKNLVHLLQVRPLPQGTRLKPTYLNLNKTLAKATPMVPADCRVRVLEKSSSVHLGVTVGEARQSFLALPTEKQAQVKAIIVSSPGGSNSHEATEFRANNIPVLCLPKQKIKTLLENEQKWLLVDTVQGKIETINRFDTTNDTLSIEQALIKKNIINKGWSKHPIPAVQTIEGDPINENDLDTFLNELLDTCKKLNLVSGKSPHNTSEKLRTLFAIMKKEARISCHYESIIETLNSNDHLKRLSAVLMTLKCAYSLYVKFKKTSLKKRAFAVARQLIADVKDVWTVLKNSNATQIERLYALNWLRATLTQHSTNCIINADSPFTLLKDYKNFMEAKNILKNSHNVTDDWRADMLSVLLNVGNYALNKQVHNNWRTFSSRVCANGDKTLIKQLAKVLHRVASVNATTNWLHAIFSPNWNMNHQIVPCLTTLVIHTSRSIKALKAADILCSIANRFNTLKPRLGSDKTFGKYWEKVRQDVQKLDKIPHLYLKQNSFGRSLLSSAIAKVVDSLDKMIKEMLGQPKKEENKIKKLQIMLRPYLKIMHDWLNLVDNRDVSGHDNVQNINKQIAKIADKLLEDSNLVDQLNISAHFNVAAAQVGSGTNFNRHQPKTLADLFTLAHQNILFALSYLKNKEAVLKKHLPKHLLKISDALSSTDMLSLRIENKKQTFVSRPPSLISVDNNFPNITMRFNAPQRNHSALFDITATLDPKTSDIKDLKVGGKLFGYQAHDMPRMPWAAAYAELCSRAGGFDFSPEGQAKYDRSRDMVSFTWKVNKSQIDKFVKHLPDYLTLITTSLYSGSRSRTIPIPGGKRTFCFTDKWELPKLDHTDNKTILRDYYARQDVSLAKSGKLRLKEAIANIKNIHPNWKPGNLKPTDLKPIYNWHKLIEKLLSLC